MDEDLFSKLLEAINRQNISNMEMAQAHRDREVATRDLDKSLVSVLDSVRSVLTQLVEHEDKTEVARVQVAQVLGLMEKKLNGGIREEFRIKWWGIVMAGIIALITATGPVVAVFIQTRKSEARLVGNQQILAGSLERLENRLDGREP